MLHKTPNPSHLSNHLLLLKFEVQVLSPLYSSIHDPQPIAPIKSPQHYNHFTSISTHAPLWGPPSVLGLALNSDGMGDPKIRGMSMPGQKKHAVHGTAARVRRDHQRRARRTI